MRIRSSVSIVVSITLVMIVLGGIGLVLLGGQRLGDYIREHIELSVVLDDDIKEVEIRKLQKTINASEYVKSTEYVTKEQAQKRLEDELGLKFSKVLDFNPLKSSINLKIQANFVHPDSVVNIEKELMQYKGVHKVFYKKGLLESITNNLQQITIILLAIAVLLLLISFTLINNTIRLSIYAQRFTINTMQIVGATDRFVRRPFVYEGILKGLLSGLIAITILAIGVSFLPVSLQMLVSVNDVYFLALLGILLSLSIIFAWFATYFAVSRYLRKHSTSLYA